MMYVYAIVIHHYIAGGASTAILGCEMHAQVP